MSDENSPSDVENQEQNPEVTETNLSVPLETDNQLDSAMREKDTLLSPPDHGWLEQFEMFGIRAFTELEKVAIQGLEEAESEILIALAFKLAVLADNHQPGAIGKLITLIDEARL